MPTRVLVDANVLVSRTLRDWLSLLHVSNDMLFSVYWTEDIVAEVIYSLRRMHPTWSGGMTTRIHDLIRNTFEGGRVDDFEPARGFASRDPHDQHVHAAAVACSAHVLLTSDQGFIGPDVDVDSLTYEVYTPDSFFVLVDDSAPDLVAHVAAEQLAFWFRRTKDVNLPHYLRKAGCPEFAKRVRRHIQHLPPPGSE